MPQSKETAEKQSHLLFIYIYVQMYKLQCRLCSAKSPQT